MLRTIIAFSALLIPAAAVAADAPATQILQRDGSKFAYTTTASPLGGLTIDGRELENASVPSRKKFTLFVTPNGDVSGVYDGAPVSFHVDRGNVAKLFASGSADTLLAAK